MFQFLSDVMGHFKSQPLQTNQSDEEFSTKPAVLVVRPKGDNMPFVCYTSRFLAGLAARAHELRDAIKEYPAGLEVVFLNGAGECLGNSGSISVDEEDIIVIKWTNPDGNNRTFGIPDAGPKPKKAVRKTWYAGPAEKMDAHDFKQGPPDESSGIHGPADTPADLVRIVGKPDSEGYIVFGVLENGMIGAFGHLDFHVYLERCRVADDLFFSILPDIAPVKIISDWKQETDNPDHLIRHITAGDDMNSENPVLKLVDVGFATDSIEILKMELDGEDIMPSEGHVPDLE